MNGRSKNNNIEIRKYEKITDKGKSQEDWKTKIFSKNKTIR
jgi:hypothetical protein